MLYVEFSLRNLAIVVIAGHLLGTFSAWLIHYLQHRRIFGIDFHQIHLRAHHDVTLRHADPVAHRRWMIVGHAQWLVMISTAAAAYFAFLVPWAAAVCVAEAFIMGLFTYYFHREYDNPRSWLARFRWFRRARALHGIHHGDFGSFDRSRNYAIGGPITGFLMDHVLGTFQDVPRR